MVIVSRSSVSYICKLKKNQLKESSCAPPWLLGIDGGVCEWKTQGRNACYQSCCPAESHTGYIWLFLTVTNDLMSK